MSSVEHTMLFKNTSGSNSRTAKLDEKQALHIFRCERNGVDRAELAAMFGVSVSAVQSIANGRNWKDVTAGERKYG